MWGWLWFKLNDFVYSTTIETSHFIKLIERIFSFEIINFFNDSIIDSYITVSLILYQGPIFIKITISLNNQEICKRSKNKF